MVVPDFRSKTVYLDAAPIIYYIEEHPAYLPKLDPIFWQIGQGQVKFVTSVISLQEVLVGPFKHGLHDLAHVYSEIFYRSEGVVVLSVDNGWCELITLHGGLVRSNVFLPFQLLFPPFKYQLNSRHQFLASARQRILYTRWYFVK